MPSPSSVAARIDRAMTERPLLIVGLYFLAHAVLRAALPVAPGYDDAAEFVRAQVLAGGYTGQPPLYTWLVWLVFAVTGPTVTGLVLLKNALLFATFALVHRIARLLGADRPVAATAMFGVFLLLQVAWKSQFTLTHTVIAVFAAALILERLLVLVERRRLTDYLAVGAVLGLGLMAKYNFPLLPLAVVAGLAMTAKGRAAFLDIRVLATLAVAALVAAPHALWVVTHLDIATSSSGKLHLGTGLAARLEGGSELIVKLIGFAGPLLLVQGLIFWRRRATAGARAEADPARAGERGALWRALGFVVIGAAAAVLISGTTEVNDHWLQPALFVVPVLTSIWLAARVPVVALAWTRVAAAVAMAAIFIGIPIACLMEPSAAGWRQAAAALRAEAPDARFAVSSNLQNSGRLIWAAPDIVVVDTSMPKLAVAGAMPALLLWTGSEAAVPADLLALAATRAGKGVAGPARQLTLPAWGARSKDKILRFAVYRPG